MSGKEREYYALDAIDSIIQGTKGDAPTETVFKIEDAGSKVAEILVPEMGSDADFQREGKVDWRRFGHISDVDPYWMQYFLQKPKFRGGNYTAKYVEGVGNLLFSVEDRHKKLAVSMQQASSGNRSQAEQPKKKRGIVDKLLGRNKDPDD